MTVMVIINIKILDAKDFIIIVGLYDNMCVAIYC